LSQQYPDDFEDPLEYYDEDEGLDGIDEVTLFALLAMQKKADPAFSYEVVDKDPTIVKAGERVFEQTGVDEDGLREFDHWRSPEEFLADVRMRNRFDAFYGDVEGKFNEDFWHYPPPLFHGTSQMEAVMQEGIEPRSESRGLSNRWVGDAVFTSLSPEVATQYSTFGDAGIVVIDTAAMKRDGYMPYVAQEPEVVEEDLSSALMAKLGLEYDIEYSDTGIDPDTVIVYGGIAPEYLTPLVE
jgi:hypothetical protein